MRSAAFFLLTLLTAVVGCTHRQLTRSTVLTTTTVMDIQYHSVLSNLAMMSLHPEALPNHVHLADGVVQVNDEIGFGLSGGFTALEDTGFGSEQYGPSGARQVTEQWGTDATTDPRRLVELQALYRVALGLPPLPEPNGIAYLRTTGTENRNEDKKKPKSGSSNPKSPESTGGGGSTASSGGDSGSESRGVPIDVLLTDVPPPGWYHIGRKKDVPKGACYVGCWGDRYAWVMPEGIPQLSQFALTTLAVIQLKPTESRGSRGLAVTR